MTLTYRTKRRLQRAGLIGLIVLIVSLLVWFCWVVWLERYMVYSRDGASLDFEWNAPATGQVAAPPSVDQNVSIYYNEGEDAVNPTTELAKMTGYYIDIDTLERGLADAHEIVSELPSGTAVMIELKDAKGKFYYTSSLEDATPADTVDLAGVDSLIKEMTGDNLYAIALLPAFRDYNYGLNHTICGLAVPQGYLWADSEYCYWLNPAHADTINWLKQIIEELRSLGFEEVVFTDFRFPDTSDIVFDGNRSETITNTAASLVSSCTTSTFAVSFKSSASFPLPAGRSRLYLEGVGAKDAATVAEESGVADPTINLVYLVTSFDTRYDDYSVLRPIDIYENAE